MNDLNLRKLEYSPLENPFFRKSKICIRDKTVTTCVGFQKLVDCKTENILTVPTIHIIEEKNNEEQFLKAFANDIREVFNLSLTGYRVFIEALKIYQSAQLTDSITLIWLDDGLNGVKLDMTNRTFHNGLKELIMKDFLKPKLRNQYWVNPAVFFKGDQSVEFVRTYHIKLSATHSNLPNDEYQTNLEDFTK
ncbi:hypothetical protein [Candidatus Bartonella washoeensis]|uniref:Plasmid replication protein RepL domain-containing protein n=1 Tax=Cardidatus Bartonella washoeensis 085-0475 TaxID=1094564 RepID=J0QN59_9HYPH|nr:hypothetical protein [Bartonella washoeensis]EJF84414.1 hypothetical protein MCW_01227 [Bartonella washoeensis 085-0475]